MGASVAGAGPKPQCGMGRAGARLDKASCPQKPGGGKSEPLAASAQEVKGLPARPSLWLSAWWSFKSLAESSHHGQSPSLGCGLGAWDAVSPVVPMPSSS